MKTKLILPVILVCFQNVSAQNEKSTNATICESYVTSASSQFTSMLGPKTNLWYDQDIDVLSFVFAYDTTAVGYAFSYDHGTTWYLDTMLYNATTLVNSGAYPQGVIYNPPGNTNPANAYVTCFGNTGSSTGHYEGTTAIGSGVNQQFVYPFNTYPNTLVPQGGTIVKNTGTTWWSAAGTTGNGVYNDTIVLAKGTFGGGNFTYTYTLLPVPVCTDNNGHKMFRNQSVIFDDSGQNGYVVVLANDWCCSGSDSAMGLIIFRTTDGGNSWGRQPSPYLDPAGSLLPVNAGHYATSTQLDLAMDQNNTLHIGLPLIPFSSGNSIFSSYPAGTWGLFDVNYSGNIYSICLIAQPEQYYGTFGFTVTTSEDNRFQLSRNWDGSKIFYTWFDTDTTIFGNVGNLFPDMHSKGLDVVSGLYTTENNFTEFTGTSFDGNSIFGNVSYYTYSDGTNENIPMISNLEVIDLNFPIEFYFIGCDAPGNYVNGGNCVITGGIPESRIDQVMMDCIIHPNPFIGQTNLDLFLLRPADVTIEITNAVGQVVSYRHEPKLNYGQNILNLQLDELRGGLYNCRITAGADQLIRKLIVK